MRKAIDTKENLSVGENLRLGWWWDKVKGGDGQMEINKAVYTTTLIACGWAGAAMKNHPKRRVTDRPTDEL